MSLTLGIHFPAAMETTYKGEPRRFSIPTFAANEGFITANAHKRTGRATSVSNTAVFRKEKKDKYIYFFIKSLTDKVGNE